MYPYIYPYSYGLYNTHNTCIRENPQRKTVRVRLTEGKPYIISDPIYAEEGEQLRLVTRNNGANRVFLQVKQGEDVQLMYAYLLPGQPGPGVNQEMGVKVPATGSFYTIRLSCMGPDGNFTETNCDATVDVFVWNQSFGWVKE